MMVTRYVPTYKLTATVSIREDLLKDGDSRKSVDQAEAVKILLESRFKRFIIAGFKIEEVEIL